MKTNKFDTKKLVGTAIFAATAYVVALVCNVIPPIAGFLSLDVKDAIIALAAFIYGPISGVLIAFIAAALELFTFSTTAWYGFIMNFASSAVFALTASLIYKFKRTLNGALVGFFSAVVATTGVMLILNTFVTPLYLTYFVGMPADKAGATVIELLPSVLLPFNFAKSLLNAASAMLLYKPVTTALARAGLVDGKRGFTFNKSSIVILVIGGISLAAAIAIFLVLA